MYPDDAAVYQSEPGYYDEAEYGTEAELGYEEEPYVEESAPSEEADLVQDEKEAYAIAQEASRTLQQARAAVAKARAARGKDSGKAKGAPKGKSNGPCYVCGQPGHRFYECPRRFSGSKGAREEERQA